MQEIPNSCANYLTTPTPIQITPTLLGKAHGYLFKCSQDTNAFLAFFTFLLSLFLVLGLPCWYDLGLSLR